MPLAASSCVNALTAFADLNNGGIKQASFDMGCPVEQLQVVDLGGGTWTVGVTGCGKKAVYKQIPGKSGQNGAGGVWVNNTSSDSNSK